MSKALKFKIDPHDWSPITVLNIEKRKLGWSPRLKKNVQIDDSSDAAGTSELKRIREVDVVIAYDQRRDRTVFIELKDSEKAGFDKIYRKYLEAGGQIMYARRKEGRSTYNVFVLDEMSRGDLDVPDKKSFLFE